MVFEHEVGKVDRAIEEEYLKLVVEGYKPLFLRVGERALGHMKSEDISEIDLGIRSRLFFRQDGNFYNAEGMQVNLEELPKLFQEESDYFAGATGQRHHTTPSIHRAMNSALSCFRGKVRQSLSDVL